MKKISERQRHRDIQRTLDERRTFRKTKKFSAGGTQNNSRKNINGWIDDFSQSHINVIKHKKNYITLVLPEKMNFSRDYENTSANIIAIRKTAGIRSPSDAYKLRSVNFDNLKEISTSAALVLTAELSRWDDHVRNNLRPNTANWDPSILQNFKDIGFFDLFSKAKNSTESNSQKRNYALNIVKYIKGSCGDSSKTRKLREELLGIINGTMDKWVILNSGLHEAITNVSHHAYPRNRGFNIRDKNWYLTGSYNKDKRQLKIVFYDQGIGIPKSLPATKVGEIILKSLAGFSFFDQRADEKLLKAAVEAKRTSTHDIDRGHGLQDLLDFIKERGQGYLSILSQKGMYKFSMSNNIETVRTESFELPINGTLIIWCVTLT